MCYTLKHDFVWNCQSLSGIQPEVREDMLGVGKIKKQAQSSH
jgi:hypothetical protein